MWQINDNNYNDYRSYPKRRKDVEEPIFLRKTYNMINESNSDIVEWKSDGSSFFVKNQEKFAELVIPMYFKHNNFSSFVRQLNFYGFRKVRQSKTMFSDPNDSTVEFKHPLFHRDKPDMLSDIKRTAHTQDNIDQNDVNHLKFQLNTLTQTVEEMANTINQLKSVISVIAPEYAFDSDSNQPIKKIRVEENSDIFAESVQPTKQFSYFDNNNEEFDQDTINMLSGIDNTFVETETHPSLPIVSNTVQSETIEQPVDSAMLAASAALGALMSSYIEANAQSINVNSANNFAQAAFLTVLAAAKSVSNSSIQTLTS